MKFLISFLIIIGFHFLFKNQNLIIKKLNYFLNKSIVSYFDFSFINLFPISLNCI
jgi:hypothetical protein